MDKFLAGLIGVCVLCVAAVIFVFSQDGLVEPDNVVFQPPADVERTAAGPARNGQQRADPIYPWDSAAVDQWIDDEIARLSKVVTDPAHLEMAENTDLQFEASVQKPMGKLHQATYEAIPMLLSSDQATVDAAQFILLNQALRSDPWAYFELAHFHSNQRTAETNIVRDLWRKAADRDHLPALVELVADWYDFDPQPHAGHVAYLHYGMELDAIGGAIPIGDNVLLYYTFKAASYDSDGYFDKALRRLEDNDELSRVRYYEGRVWQKGVERPIDNAKALIAFQEAFDLGHDRALIQIARTHQEAQGVPYNKQEAVNAYMSCIKHMGHRACYLNLGIVFDDPSNNSADNALAHALYSYAQDIGGSGYTLARTNADSIAELLTVAERRKSTGYLAMMRDGRIADIPQLAITRDYLDQ